MYHSKDQNLNKDLFYGGKMCRDCEKGALINVAWEITKIAFAYDEPIITEANSMRESMTAEFNKTLTIILKQSGWVLTKEDK
ncbi:MAG: hypothetical protein AB2L18_11885 [Anaerolineaceae bacterium]